MVIVFCEIHMFASIQSKQQRTLRLPVSTDAFLSVGLLTPLQSGATSIQRFVTHLLPTNCILLGIFNEMRHLRARVKYANPLDKIILFSVVGFHCFLCESHCDYIVCFASPMCKYVQYSICILLLYCEQTFGIAETSLVSFACQCHTP